jgi:hypothetical protein
MSKPTPLRAKFDRLQLALDTSVVDAWNELETAGVSTEETSAAIDRWHREFLAA